jgi:hypothetical protein
VRMQNVQLLKRPTLKTSQDVLYVHRNYSMSWVERRPVNSMQYIYQ